MRRAEESSEPVPSNTLEIVLIVGFLILSLGIHEAAHAWVANLCGDSTARDMGRMTLNPIVHIDPFFTIVLPAVLLLTSGFAFGGAKPVPVAYHRLRSPLRDMMLVALAGPLSNVILAVLFMVALKVTVYTLDMPVTSLAVRVLQHSVSFNLVLAIFNMIPIPPLDGSRVMAFLLPQDLREPYVRLETFGMLIVFGLLVAGVFQSVLLPAVSWSFDKLSLLTGGVWA